MPEKSGEDWRVDFEQAMGESFGENISPPIPFEDASPHECCEVIWEFVGRNVTPSDLSRLDTTEIAALATAFGEYFECDAPTPDQVRDGVAQTLARWPPGSLGESQ